MSLVFQNIAGGNAGAGKTSAAGSKAGSGTNAAATVAAAGTFDQSLAQMMSGEGTPSNAAAIIGSGTLLEGLMQLAGLSSMNDDGTSEGQTAADLLQTMLGGTDKLDDAVDSHPELLAALQGWLQQIQNLLDQSGQSPDVNPQENANALTGPLAESPATIRFVVQDGLAQLVSMLQQKAEGNQSAPLQAMKLLQSFQEILGDLLPVQPKQTSEQTTAASRLSQVKAETLSAADARLSNPVLEWVQQSQESGGKISPLLSALLSKSNASGNDQPSLIKADQAAAGTNAPSTDTQDQANDIFASQQTVTAGQLALRQGIHASVKADAPVPVEKFSQEMTGFVVSKLDFVKQQGISEARITLYPEHLGQVDIKLTMQNGQLVAQFTTEHAATKDLLEQQMSQLRSSLQTQGVQVEKLVVSQNQSLQSQMYHDGRQPNSGQQQSNRRSKEKEAPTDDAIKIAEMGEELNEWLAEQEAAQGGNSFTAKA
ncbi:flagellar hook-length control protein FliK [Paenibacillus chibensis]|uniref:Flagellar hook-length control protein FliK n=1 Tax=Paenibacillus chibensis TaxID=59846 RepID=A0ABU6PPT6_9BACL|nr:flagellar hook-length control protein FliK [Paenibacillus chibensis]